MNDSGLGSLNEVARFFLGGGGSSSLRNTLPLFAPIRPAVGFGKSARENSSRRKEN